MTIRHGLSPTSEGTNELTAKLSCDVGPFNSTKYDSVTVTGIPTED
jgi:hypothetical protein